MGDTDPVEGLREFLHAHDPSKRGPTFHHSDSLPSTHEVEDGIQPHLDSVDRDEWPDPPDDLDADARRLLAEARHHGRVPLGRADEIVGDTFGTLAELRERDLASLKQREANGIVVPVEPDG